MSTSTPASATVGQPQQTQPKRRNGRRRHQDTNIDDPNLETTTSRRPRNRRNNNNTNDAAPSNLNSQQGSTAESSAPRPKRGAKFNAGLTEASRPQGSGNNHRSHKNAQPLPPQQDDLTSTLIHAMKTPPYPDCPICFSAIHPAQPTWSCSPLTPVVSVDNAPAQYCWTTFHVKCIRSWAGKSVKNVADAWLARGENHRGDWRCPGCQAKREIVPSGYSCFCGSTPEPKPPRLATPHSCANGCSRSRTCGHACPISCHPGPCPPCQVTTHLPCFCGKKTLAFRCSHINNTALGGVQHSELSCGKVCEKKLACGNHSCNDICHDGDCAPCSVLDNVRCYCGKETKTVSCGEGDAKVSAIDATDGLPADRWVGRFECINSCDRPFECGVHRCSKPCHTPSSSPPLCPRSPALMTHCPCGKHELSASSADFFSSAFSNSLIRNKCTDPIATCESMCLKPLSGCSHACTQKCHFGPCPPCSMMIVRPCRCGTLSRDVRCSDLRTENAEIFCDRPCTALRACGRHTCNRICCPLASLTAKSKGKKRAAAITSDLDPAGLHECDLVCGKLLGCGNHRCEHKDHRGVCPPCLRSSFEEMVCHCGRTVLEPPIPCGTVMKCRNLCTRAPPACGHPMTPHGCHEDPDMCPPCPFLTAKKCSCGKKVVGNVRCSQEKVSCGIVCGHLLGCGFHPCERLCHSDDHGACSAVCGKPRKLCLPDHHPHSNTCHAPSACSEVEPCQSKIILTCPCKRMRQSVACGKSTSNPLGRVATQLKCTNDCTRATRNARLAQALGINVGANGDKIAVTWNEEVIAFAKANMKFLSLVEKTLADFIASEKKTQVLPHMPPERRKFVHDIAVVYRLDTQMVDQEPHRSVQIIRRIDTRIPTPTLSIVATPPVAPNLGKLADLRGTNAPAWRPVIPPRVRVSVPPTVTGAPVASTSRAWGSSGANAAVSSGPRVQTRSPLPEPSAGSDIGETPVPEDWEDEV